MTTRDRQIAAAVIEAAAKICEHREGYRWEHRDTIRALDLDAILASVPKQEDADLDALQALAEAATPGPWVVQTGNSWRRIGSTGDGDVLCPTKHHIDGWPDLSGPMANLDYIAAANPAAILSLIDRLHKAEVTAMRQAVMVQLLLDHCKEPECHTCAEIICPHNEPLHFHHDGCPACYERDAPDSADSATERKS